MVCFSFGMAALLGVRLDLLLWSSEHNLHGPQFWRDVNAAYRKARLDSYETLAHATGDPTYIHARPHRVSDLSRNPLRLFSMVPEQISQPVLLKLWEMFEANLCAAASATHFGMGILIQMHGQKCGEAFGPRTGLPGAYVQQLERLIVWTELRNLQVSVATTAYLLRRPCMSLFSTRAASATPLVPPGGTAYTVALCDFLKAYEVGSVDSVPALLQRSIDERYPNPSLRPRVTHWILYCPAIHSFRSPAVPFHHFDLHRMLVLLLAPPSHLDSCLSAAGTRTKALMDKFADYGSKVLLEDLSTGVRLEISYRMAMHDMEMSASFTLQQHLDGLYELNTHLWRQSVEQHHVAHPASPLLLAIPSQTIWGKVRRTLKSFLDRMEVILRNRSEATVAQKVTFAIMESLSGFAFSGNLRGSAKLLIRIGLLPQFHNDFLTLNDTMFDPDSHGYTGANIETVFEDVKECFRASAKYSLAAHALPQAIAYVSIPTPCSSTAVLSAGERLADVRKMVTYFFCNVLPADIAMRLNRIVTMKNFCSRTWTPEDAHDMLTSPNPLRWIAQSGILSSPHDDQAVPYVAVDDAVLPTASPVSMGQIAASVGEIVAALLSPTCRCPAYSAVHPTVVKISDLYSCPGNPLTSPTLADIFKAELESRSFTSFPAMPPDCCSFNVHLLRPFAVPNESVRAVELRIASRRTREPMLLSGPNGFNCQQGGLSDEEFALYRLCLSDLIVSCSGERQEQFLLDQCVPVFVHLASLHPLPYETRAGYVLIAARYSLPFALSAAQAAAIRKKSAESYHVLTVDAVSFWTSCDVPLVHGSNTAARLFSQAKDRAGHLVLAPTKDFADICSNWFHYLMTGE